MVIAQGKMAPSTLNIMATGPYLDALSSVRLWVMTFGQAVFDRATDHFIGCTLVDVSVAQLYDILEGSTQFGNTSQSALARWDDFGTVIVASQWDPNVEDEVAYLSQDHLGIGVTPEIYQEMTSLVDYTQPWNPEEIKERYKSTTFESNQNGEERLIMLYPIPDIPNEYDALYEPLYMIVISMARSEAYGLLDEMEDLIIYDVTETWERIGMIGGIGFGVVMIVVTYISSTLTKPLRWMQKVSGIVRCFVFPMYFVSVCRIILFLLTLAPL